MLRTLRARKGTLKRQHAKLHERIKAEARTLSDAELSVLKRQKCLKKTAIQTIEAQIAELEAAAKMPRLVHSGEPVPTGIVHPDTIRSKCIAATA